MISILYGGGTISSTVTAEGYRVAGSAVQLIDELKAAKPESKQLLASITLADPIVMYEGLSENITELHQLLISEKIKDILESQTPTGILLTFGTDSMLQMTNYLCDSLCAILEDKNIPLILTGANKDRQDTDTDVWDNLLFALDSFSSVTGGVFIAFDHSIIAAKDAVMEPFDGVCMKYTNKNFPAYGAKREALEAKREELIEPFRVPIETGLERQVMLYSVNKTDIFNHASLYQAVEALKTKIIVFVLYHSGTANVESTTASVSDLVFELTKMGVTCFGASENGEPVDLNAYETSVQLRTAGMIPLYNMDYMVAFEKAKYMLQLGVHPLKYIDAMYTDCFGEIDPDLVNQKHKAELIELYETLMTEEEENTI